MLSRLVGLVLGCTLVCQDQLAGQTAEQWPLETPRVTQAYGCYNCVEEVPNRFHSGLDLGSGPVQGACGAAVYPIANGDVVRIYKGCPQEEDGTDCGGPYTCGRGYGNHVIVRHTLHGEWVYAMYAHLDNDLETEGLSLGPVFTSTKIGLVGKSGGVGACHLHLATFKGNPQSSDVYTYPEECLTSSGVGAYVSTFPDQGCQADCRNPQSFFETRCLSFPGGLPIYDAPGGALLDAVVAPPNQVYVSLATAEVGGDDWTMVTLPGPLGPTGSLYPAPESITHGWIQSEGTPEPCLPVQVKSGTLVGAHGHGAYVFDRTEGLFDISLVWSGDWIAPTEVDAPDDFCDFAWYRISVPEERTVFGGDTEGWVCGEYLDLQGGQCTPLELAGAARGEVREVRKASFPSLGCPSPPSVSTNSAIQVTPNSALLRMTVNPNGSPTTVWFGAGATPVPISPTPTTAIGSGVSSVSASAVLSGLSCNTSYSFRAIAQNEGGQSSGSSVSFTTDSCVGGGGGAVQLIGNGGFESGTTGWDRGGSFRISAQSCPFAGAQYAYLSHPDGTPGNNLVGTLERAISIPDGATDVELSYRYSIATDETGSTPYDVLSVTIVDESGDETLRLLKAYSNVNALAGCGGPAYRVDTFDISEFEGEDIRLRFLGTTDATLPTIFRIDSVSLTATVPQGGEPVVVTKPASERTDSSALLNLEVQPSGLPTSVWFEWDDDEALSYETAEVSVGSSSGTEQISIPLTGLDCSTRYWFKAFAENADGDDSGSRLNFLTQPCAGEPPHADTDPAEAISPISARLTADITPNGLSTEAWFEWGESPALGQSTPQTGVGSSNNPQDFEFNLTDLECGTTYYFEAHAENAEGEDDGSTEIFETLDCGTPVPADDFLLFVDSWIGCSETAPAVLLGWTMPEGVAPVVTVERVDGTHSVQIDTTTAGAHALIDQGLLPGGTYEFRARGMRDDYPIESNIVTARAVPAECDFPVSDGEIPHRPVLWAEPPYCLDGNPAVRLRWSEVLGATSFDLQRLQIPGGVVLSVTGIETNDYVDVSIRPGDGLLYQVSAKNAAGSRASGGFGVLIPSDVCSPVATPAPFEVESVSLSCSLPTATPSVELDWSPSTGATGGYRADTVYENYYLGFTDTAETVEEINSKNFFGTVARFRVQAIATGPPEQTQDAPEVGVLVPDDLCGPGTQAPFVSTSSTSYAEPYRAVLNASVAARLSETTARFQWGLSTSYGMTTPSLNFGSGWNSQLLSQEIAGLACATTYHYRATATNANGTSFGEDRTLHTDACPVELFADGFESGDTSQWSASTGLQ